MRRTAAAAAAATALASLLVACTGQPEEETPFPDSEVETVRWWSTDADEAGTPIRIDDAETAADRIAPDTGAYCAALEDTMAASESILPADVEASDEGYQLLQRTFFAEVAALAPGDLGDAWRSVAATFQALIAADGDLTAIQPPEDEGLPPTEEALTAIETHAAAECGLSAPTP